jgi:hypothetical protein
VSGKRPKGYAEWNPALETLEVLAYARRILNEYSHYGPMTARQIFYRLVGQYGYDKTEKAYKRLTNYLVRARRARMIPFHAIRDDGTVEQGGGGWSSATSFWRGVRATAKNFTLDHQQGQPYEIELWCEAAGMAPMLANMTRQWHIPIYSTGGFSSVTVTHEAAERIARRNRPTAFLHIGDYDPSGESIFESMSQDIGAFVAEMQGGEYDPTYGDATNGRGDPWFIPERVALTRAQVSQYDLPTAPAKSTDMRSVNWFDSTTQAEALPPDQLDDIVVVAIEQYIDEDILSDTLKREQQARQGIMSVLNSVEE